MSNISLLWYNKLYSFVRLVMKIFNASEARANLFSLLQQVNQDHHPRIITSKKGDAVLISREDWESLQETIYLQSISHLVESIKEAEEALTIHSGILLLSFGMITVRLFRNLSFKIFLI